MPRPNSLKYLFYLLLLLTCEYARAQQYWQQKVDHKIDVSLDVNTNSLDAYSRIRYTNNSPDTLRFIWFHLWPNAYRNDRTAFSDHQLENGNTDFYFSSKEQRGYINRLDFRINEQSINTEDHPEHIDIIKLILPSPLAPGSSVVITTPFHVQLPYNFSRGGYHGKTYQVTQWFPKPAVYDKNGWHPMPYLDQGEFYSEFGDYEVNITVPAQFTVASTGEPQQKTEDVIFIPPAKKKKPGTTTKKTSSSTKKKIAPPPAYDWSKAPKKTLSYKQQMVHDFAWFADTSFTLQRDTVRLPSGKVVNLQLYFHLDKLDVWEYGIQYMKDAIRVLSAWVGEYPYSYCTVVDGEQGFTGGMEYPTITILTGMGNRKDLDLTIFHEIGHNWFQGALATNERKFPWMDEGMNSYYENRYAALKYPPVKLQGLMKVLQDPRFPELLYQQQAAIKQDQPITTPADSFTAANYSHIAYTKASLWMKKLEKEMGQPAFDKAMRTYYERWKFRHPYREDFREVIEEASPGSQDTLFSLLDKKGVLPPAHVRPWKLFPLYKLEKTYDHKPVFITPIVSYNTFNGIMPGLAFHNYSLPFPRFNFAIAPFYGIKSGKLNGWGRLAYQWYPDEVFSNIELAVVGSKFNQRNFVDSFNNKFSLAFQKLAPSLKFVFKENNPRSTYYKMMQLRYFTIREDQLNFSTDANNNTVVTTEKEGFNILQARFVIQNIRKLYPWKAELLTESHNDFYKLNFTGNYFFNFRKKGGVNVRMFAGKFFYKGDQTISEQFSTQRFHLNMSGPKGIEDYTYSNPFIGRFDNEGFFSQQIMIRDGAFKVRTDLLANEVGRTDTWLSALNFTMDVPDRFNILNALPIKIPLKLFLDVGTYGDVWNSKSEEARFLYDAGIQISLLRNLVNFYVPLLYSRPYRDYFKSVPGNNFFQRISFTINIQDLNIRELTQSFGR